jgi:hypothetical protein
LNTLDDRFSLDLLAVWPTDNLNYGAGSFPICGGSKKPQGVQTFFNSDEVDWLGEVLNNNRYK